MESSEECKDKLPEMPRYYDRGYRGLEVLGSLLF